MAKQGTRWHRCVARLGCGCEWELLPTEYESLEVGYMFICEDHGEQPIVRLSRVGSA